MKEIWKPVVGFEEFYEVSNFGQIRSLPRKCWNGQNYFILKPRILKQGTMDNGYKKVNLYKDKVGYRWLVHRVVAMAFLEGDFSLDVNHKDGNKANNHVENLEWATRSENCLHAKRVLKAGIIRGTQASEAVKRGWITRKRNMELKQKLGENNYEFNC